MTLRPRGFDLLLQPPLEARQARLLDVFAVGHVGQALARADDTEEVLDLLVVGNELVVGDGPVLAEPVAARRLEVVVGHTDGDPAPGQEPSAHVPPADPEIGVARVGVGVLSVVHEQERFVHRVERVPRLFVLPFEKGLHSGERQEVQIEAAALVEPRLLEIGPGLQYQHLEARARPTPWPRTLRWRRNPLRSRHTSSRAYRPPRTLALSLSHPPCGARLLSHDDARSRRRPPSSGPPRPTSGCPRARSTERSRNRTDAASRRTPATSPHRGRSRRCGRSSLARAHQCTASCRARPSSVGWRRRSGCLWRVRSEWRHRAPGWRRSGRCPARRGGSDRGWRRSAGRRWLRSFSMVSGL